VADLFYFAHDLRACAGEEVTLTVRARNSVALLGYGVSLCLDPGVFECLEISLEGTQGAGAQFFESQCAAAGCVTAGVILALGCPPQIDPGDGAILAIRVLVRPDAPVGPTTIDFTPVGPAQNTMGPCQGSAIDPTVLDGVVEICAPASRPDGR
jgi:hypothetical protein